MQRPNTDGADLELKLLNLKQMRGWLFRLSVAVDCLSLVCWVVSRPAWTKMGSDAAGLGLLFSFCGGGWRRWVVVAGSLFLLYLWFAQGAMD